MERARQRPLGAAAFTVERARALRIHRRRLGRSLRPGAELAQARRSRHRSARGGAAQEPHARRSGAAAARLGARTRCRRIRADARAPALDDDAVALASAIRTAARDALRPSCSRRRPARARFSTWYELFPRSARRQPDARHASRLRGAPAVRRGDGLRRRSTCRRSIRSARPSARARTTRSTPSRGDPGSPWAIGAQRGRPQGDPSGARHARGLRASASPRRARPRHRDRARHRVSVLARSSVREGASGVVPQAPRRHESSTRRTRRRSTRTSIRSTSSPTAGEALWEELEERLRVLDRRRASRIFRVDNPHTKPFAFWEWVIGEVKREHPEVIFLAEAFTRPKVMYRLAKLGFTQSYTYFTWRNTQAGADASTSRSSRRAPAREYFRPNFWPNTPDILHRVPAVRRAAGVHGARSCWRRRSAASYGIYGPAFELLEHDAARAGQRGVPATPRSTRSRHWDLERAGQPARLHRAA